MALLHMSNPQPACGCGDGGCGEYLLLVRFLLGGVVAAITTSTSTSLPDIVLRSSTLSVTSAVSWSSAMSRTSSMSLASAVSRIPACAASIVWAALARQWQESEGSALTQPGLQWGYWWWEHHICPSEALFAITKRKKKKTKTFFDSRCPGEPQCV